MGINYISSLLFFTYRNCENLKVYTKSLLNTFHLTVKPLVHGFFKTAGYNESDNFFHVFNLFILFKSLRLNLDTSKIFDKIEVSFIYLFKFNGFPFGVRKFLSVFS